LTSDVVIRLTRKPRQVGRRIVAVAVSSLWVSGVIVVVGVGEPGEMTGGISHNVQEYQMECEGRTCRDIISFAIDIGGLCCRG